MNLQSEFTRINGALSNCENGEKLSQDLAKIQLEFDSSRELMSYDIDQIKFLYKELNEMTTLADELSGLCGELIDNLCDGSRYRHDMERKFNQIMKVRK